MMTLIITVQWFYLNCLIKDITGVHVVTSYIKHVLLGEYFSTWNATRFHVILADKLYHLVEKKRFEIRDRQISFAVNMREM